MLKANELMSYVLILLLMVEKELQPLVAYFLAFSAGLALYTLPELIRGKLPFREFFIRLLYIYGLVVIGLLFFDDKEAKQWRYIYVVIVTLFSEIIVKLIMKYGKLWLEKKAKNFENE